MAQLTIGLVGWRADEQAVTYLRSLAGLVDTMRIESPQNVAVSVCLADDADHLAVLMRQQVDVLVYGGHGGVLDGGFYLCSVKADNADIWLADVGEIRAGTVVLDCCDGGGPQALGTLASLVTRPTAVMGCRQRAMFTHGPVLLPMLLARLACPSEPRARDAQEMADAMADLPDLASKVWGRGDFGRWAVTVVQPAPQQRTAPVR